jgi:uncharacterized protein (DUF4415 family)
MSRFARRGRPAQAVTKVAVKLRLDRDVVAAFKVDGLELT